MINIHPISDNKKQYLDLLLLADEQESMIDRYLERGEMYVLSDDDDIKAACVITCEGNGIYEIKNIAVYPKDQCRGYGKRLIAFILEHYKDRCHTLLVGTGESPLTIPFYESCGFVYSHRIPDFFVKNYDHPIVEEGKQLKDMIYLKRMLHTPIQPRIEQEKQTVERMIRLYCRKKEGNKQLCPRCEKLLEYAHARLSRCPFGEKKSTCRQCTIHCYKPEMKERMREVMRYAGPRMLLYHPSGGIPTFMARIQARLAAC